MIQRTRVQKIEPKPNPKAIKAFTSNSLMIFAFHDIAITTDLISLINDIRAVIKQNAVGIDADYTTVGRGGTFTEETIPYLDAPFAVDSEILVKGEGIRRDRRSVGKSRRR